MRKVFKEVGPISLESLKSTTRPTQRRAFETKKFAKQDKNYE